MFFCFFRLLEQDSYIESLQNKADGEAGTFLEESFIFSQTDDKFVGVYCY